MTKILSLVLVYFTIALYVGESNAQPYIFELPDRPVISQKAFDMQIDFISRFNQQDSLDQSARDCSRVTSLISKIYDKIILANNLDQSKTDLPSIPYDISCLNVLPNGTGFEIGVRRSVISIPASIVLWSKSEDEIAFSIAHEIAHVLLGHPESIIQSGFMFGEDNEFQKANEMILNSEHEADKLGVVLTANSGYDPLAAIDSIWHNKQFYSESLLMTYSPFIWYSEGGGFHGTIRERKLIFENSLDEIGFGGFNSERTISQDLKDAKKEVKEIVSKIKR